MGKNKLIYNVLDMESMDMNWNDNHMWIVISEWNAQSQWTLILTKSLCCCQTAQRLIAVFPTLNKQFFCQQSDIMKIR